LRNFTFCVSAIVKQYPAIPNALLILSTNLSWVRSCVEFKYRDELLTILQRYETETLSKKRMFE